MKNQNSPNMKDPHRFRKKYSPIVFFLSFLFAATVTGWIRENPAHANPGVCNPNYDPLAYAPDLQTLKAQYAFNQSAVIVGTGYGCGLNLTLFVSQPDGVQGSYFVTTDEYGTFSYEYPLSSGAVEGDYLVTVIDQDGVTTLATTQFFASFAVLNTDKTDYIPNEIVIITGAGWDPNEVVDLLLVEEPLIHEAENLQAIADENGEIYNDDYLIQQHDLGQKFTLSATGDSSGLTAQTKFTDSHEECEEDSDCNDNNSCTNDWCDDGECEHSNKSNGSSCSDGLYCNGSDTCNSGVCSNHGGDPCASRVGDNDNDCSESCNESTDSCTANDPSGSSCNDGLYCNGSDTCNGSNSCSNHGGDPCAGGSDCNNSCSETNDNCFNPVGTACGSQSDTDCDNPNSCNGSGSCQENYEATTTLCRSDTGECDVAEYCDGYGSCPTDAFEPNGTSCGSQSDTDCDNPNTCSSGTCQENYEPNTTVCRASSGDCDTAEYCNGSESCPADAFEPDGTTCGSQSDTDCDNPNTCSSGTCQENYEPAEVACPNDHNPCTRDECNGYGECGTPIEEECSSCSKVSDSSLCPLGEDPFRLIYIQDPTSLSLNNYRLNSSNPGQFYYNVFYDGAAPGDSVNLTMLIPYPFVTHGATPIHIYDGAGLSGGCFVPENSVPNCTIETEGGNMSPNGSEIILIGDYDPQNLGDTTLVHVHCDEMPASGMLYINMHLNFGLKKTTGWTKDMSNAGHHPEFATGDGEVVIENPETYDFLTNGGVCGDSATSNNVFKNNPGVNGATLKTLTGEPVSGVQVQLYGPTGKLLKTATTDIDGVFMLSYKATGKVANYTVKLPTYGLQKTVPLKANGYGVVLFEDLP